MDQVFVRVSNIRDSVVGPDRKTFPSGNRCIRGYSGGIQPDSYSWLHPEPTVYISTVEFVTPGVSESPENVITLPSPSAVAVGYQRPWAMASTSVNWPVAGS